MATLTVKLLFSGYKYQYLTVTFPPLARLFSNLYTNSTLYQYFTYLIFAQACHFISTDTWRQKELKKTNCPIHHKARFLWLFRKNTRSVSTKTIHEQPQERVSYTKKKRAEINFTKLFQKNHLLSVQYSFLHARVAQIWYSGGIVTPSQIVFFRYVNLQLKR